MSILIVVLLFVALDLAAMRWGAVSNDGFRSPEWERRGRWRAFGGDEW